MPPTEMQLQAIQAPINKAMRVLAPPGSGKTYLLSYRYAYLVEHGVKPETIIAVTFSKSMATELLDRIQKITPSAFAPFICTIHALCYRIIKTDGDKRQVAKEWQIKQAIETAAAYVDLDAGWQEIEYWLNRSKAEGIAVSDERTMLSFFRIHGLNQPQARSLASIREIVERDFTKQELITFSDMLLEVDVRLRDDAKFRKTWQDKIFIVIVDECQDTLAQAMRILVTLAVDYPENPIYNSK